MHRNTNRFLLFFSSNNTPAGAGVVRHRGRQKSEEVRREVRGGHDGGHRASSRSFGLPDGRRRKRTVHRKDESADERMGREVQKIRRLFRQTVVWSHVFRVERGVWTLQQLWIEVSVPGKEKGSSFGGVVDRGDSNFQRSLSERIFF